MRSTTSSPGRTAISNIPKSPSCGLNSSLETNWAVVPENTSYRAKDFSRSLMPERGLQGIQSSIGSTCSSLAQQHDAAPPGASISRVENLCRKSVGQIHCVCLNQAVTEPAFIDFDDASQRR